MIPFLHTALALAQVAIVATVADATSASDDPSLILSGPKVVVTERPPSLVSRDMSGRLERLETRPEVAAVELLTLTPEQRTEVNALLLERARKIDTALDANMDLFLEIQSARQGNDHAAARALLRRFRDKVPTLIEPPLAQQISATLPEASRREFTRLVDEYAQALAAEEAANRSPDADRRTPDHLRRLYSAGPGADAAASKRFETSQLIREMARALSSIVSERRERTEALIAAIDATTEQQTQIETLIRQSAEASRDAGRDVSASMSAERRADVTRQIMALLTPEQQVKLRAFLRDE